MSKLCEKNPIKKYKLICIQCGNEYELEIKESFFKRNIYRKTCSDKCSHSYSSSFVSGTKKISCFGCGKEIEVNIRATKKTYCKDCKKNTKYYLYKNNNRYKINENYQKICKYCGQEKCLYPEICNNYKQINTFIKYLNFDKTKIGSLEFYDEYYKVKELLYKEYYENDLSLLQISKKYNNINFKTLALIFERFNIKLRNQSDAVSNAYKNGLMKLNNVNVYPYKSGYYTTKFNEKCYFRSSYELEYFKFLDEKNIFFKSETLRINYFDKVKRKFRTAIPDIYIPNENRIIEIKSSWTYNKKNMDDKILEYKKLGYNVTLIIGGNKSLFQNCEIIEK
jgi:hypothetical protein